MSYKVSIFVCFLCFWVNRRDVLCFFVKKIEQFFAENVTYRFIKPANTRRNTTGFFSQGLSLRLQLLLLSILLTILALHPPLAVTQQKQQQQHPLMIKRKSHHHRIQIQSLAPIQHHEIITLVTPAAYLSIWWRHCPVGV